jgi:hypothetical protein
MPKPVYILCAENITEDKSSGLISIYSVLERIEIKFQVMPQAQPLPQQQPFPPIGGFRFPTTFKAIAVWAREPSDVGKSYEGDWIISVPGSDRVVIPANVLRFTRDANLNRNILVSMLPITQSGTVVIEHRIKRKGANTWKHQRCEIEAIVHGDIDTKRKNKPNRSRR